MSETLDKKACRMIDELAELFDVDNPHYLAVEFSDREREFIEDLREIRTSGRPLQLTEKQFDWLTAIHAKAMRQIDTTEKLPPYKPTEDEEPAKADAVEDLRRRTEELRQRHRQADEDRRCFDALPQAKRCELLARARCEMEVEKLSEGLMNEFQLRQRAIAVMNRDGAKRREMPNAQ